MQIRGRMTLQMSPTKCSFFRLPQQEGMSMVLLSALLVLHPAIAQSIHCSSRQDKVQRNPRATTQPGCSGPAAVLGFSPGVSGVLPVVLPLA